MCVCVWLLQWVICGGLNGGLLDWCLQTASGNRAATWCTHIGICFVALFGGHFLSKLSHNTLENILLCDVTGEVTAVGDFFSFILLLVVYVLFMRGNVYVGPLLCVLMQLLQSCVCLCVGA